MRTNMAENGGSQTATSRPKKIGVQNIWTYKEECAHLPHWRIQENSEVLRLGFQYSLLHIKCLILEDVQ